jgi:trans-2,3-dihydro-3-hydroxyanthranilate isomerase
VKYSIVDVFAEGPYQGNPLAVVEDAGRLDAATMQAIAREMNLSETTFVTTRSADRAAVRIFTPHEELPFAGHPTLGTAWVLSRGERPFTLALGAGDVPVRFVDGIAWMTPPPSTVGEPLPTAVAAKLVGLRERDLDPALPPCVIRCGPPYSLIAVRSRAELARIRVDARAFRADGTDAYPFTVCRGGHSGDADFAARMHFFDGVGVREDPATGSASAAFAGYLRARGETGAFVLEQGFEIARPSRIYLRVGTDNAVGGRVRPVAEGNLVP